MTDKKTSPILFPTERTKILSVRISQLERCAHTNIKAEDLPGLSYTPRNIAIKELELNQIPMKIVRTLPDGTKEYWKTEEFEYRF